MSSDLGSEHQARGCVVCLGQADRFAVTHRKTSDSQSHEETELAASRILNTSSGRTFKQRLENSLWVCILKQLQERGKDRTKVTRNVFRIPYNTLFGASGRVDVQNVHLGPALLVPAICTHVPSPCVHWVTADLAQALSWL